MPETTLPNADKSGKSFNPEARDWSILTKTVGGVVSVIRELTLNEAQQMWERLSPDYGRYIPREEESFISMPADGWRPAPEWRVSSNGDIEFREVFGPAGWDAKEVSTWQDWPRVESPEQEAERKRQWEELRAAHRAKKEQRLREAQEHRVVSYATWVPDPEKVTTATAPLFSRIQRMWERHGSQ